MHSTPSSSTSREGRASPPPSEATTAPVSPIRLQNAESEDEQHGRGERDVDARVEPRGGRERGAGGAHHAAEAPARVQRGHDRPPHRALDRRAVGVLGHVEDAVRQPDREQQRGERHRGRREQRERERDREGDDGHEHDEPARAALEHLPGDRHRDQRARGHREQAQPDHALGETELVPQPRDVRQQRPDADPVDEEDPRRRPARRHATGTVRPSAAARYSAAMARACPTASARPKRGRASPRTAAARSSSSHAYGLRGSISIRSAAPSR